MALVIECFVNIITVEEELFTVHFAVKTFTLLAKWNTFSLKVGKLHIQALQK